MGRIGDGELGAVAATAYRGAGLLDVLGEVERAAPDAQRVAPTWPQSIGVKEPPSRAHQPS